MKLTFIGTSHGVPEHDRKLSCSMLEIGGKYYFIDMGTPVTQYLRRRNIDINDVKLVVCTHPHGDHTDGLIDFVDLSSWYFHDVSATVLLPEPKLIKAMEMWFDAIQTNDGEISENMDVHAYEAGMIYDDGTVKITAYPTKHCAPYSYALLFEAEGKKILFTGDMKGPSRDFPDMRGIPLDLIVCESAHFWPDEGIPVFDTLDVKRVLINHVVPKMEPSLAKIVGEPHPYQYGVAHDDMEVTI